MIAGTTVRERRVIARLSCDMTNSVTPRVMTSENTVATVPTACWAPSTSLLYRLRSEPVWVLVKKAIGIRWTCSYRTVRRS